MTKVRNENENENETDISIPEDKTMLGKQIPPQSEKSCTSLNTPTKGQTAPSSKTGGRVWLRYVPRERSTDKSDTT